MPIHLQKIVKDSLIYTLALGTLVALISALFPISSKLSFLGGLVWGMVVALIGLVLICHLASSLSGNVGQEKNRGAIGYVGRYMFYAATLLLGAWLHLSVLSMLLGIMIQKLSIVIYALKERATQEKLEKQEPKLDPEKAVSIDSSFKGKDCL